MAPQRTSADADVAFGPESLITRLTDDLERTIAFAEECRWRFPELQSEAEELSAQAMALFSKSLRALRARSSQEP